MTATSGTPDDATLALSAVRVPGGVAAPDGTTLFLASPTPAVDAVTVADGAVRWTSSDAELPLLALDDVVAAARVRDGAAGGLELVALAPADGRVRARAAVPTGAGNWRIEDVLASPGGTLRVTWRAVAERPRGPKVPDAQRPNGTAGAMVFDLRTGSATVERVADERPGTAPAARPPDTLPLDRFAGRTLLLRPDGQPAVWAVDDGWLALALEPIDGTPTVVLHRSTLAGDTSAPLLAPAPSIAYVTPFLSDGGRAVALLVTNEVEEDGHAPGSVVRWRVHDTRDGALRLTMPLEPGTEMPPAVVGDRFLYATVPAVPPNDAVREGPRVAPRYLTAIALDARHDAAVVAWRRQIAGRPLPIRAV